MADDYIDLLIQYQDKFGEPYLLNPEYQTDEEVIAGIKQCLETGKPRQKDSGSDTII